MRQKLKWADIEPAVYEYVKSKGIKLTLEQFRFPRVGGKSGRRRYIGPRTKQLDSFQCGPLSAPWIKTSDGKDYDDSLWRGVNAWVAFCSMVRAKCDEGRSCEDICDWQLAS